MSKTEVIPLRKWLHKGKDFDYVVMCTKCQETTYVTQLQDIFVCKFCGLDLRSFPSLAARFTVWRENLVPVFPWIDPVKTIRQRKQTKKQTAKKRKSFDE